MIGGPTETVKRLDPIFKCLAPGQGNVDKTPGRDKIPGTAVEGYLHCGPEGAGHFVKMVHNGIEYGIMAAYGEGLNILQHANAGKSSREVDAETTPLRNPEHYQYDFNLADITEVWRGGVVAAGPDGDRDARRSEAGEVLGPRFGFGRRPLDHSGGDRIVGAGAGA